MVSTNKAVLAKFGPEVMPFRASSSRGPNVADPTVRASAPARESASGNIPANSKSVRGLQFWVNPSQFNGPDTGDRAPTPHIRGMLKELVIDAQRDGRAHPAPAL